jgi:hypothetical protein
MHHIILFLSVAWLSSLSEIVGGVFSYVMYKDYQLHEGEEAERFSQQWGREPVEAPMFGGYANEDLYGNSYGSVESMEAGEAGGGKRVEAGEAGGGEERNLL